MSETERRAYQRKRVLFGVQAESKRGKQNGKVRNFSEAGACVEFPNATSLQGDIALTIAHTKRAYQGKVIWAHANKAGIAFDADAPSIVPDQNADLEMQLRKSERQLRILRNRVRDLTGGG